MLKPITLFGEQKKVLFLPPTDPIQIKGVAGSGKTTVSLYRAKHLLETQNNLFRETQITIFTYNKTLSAYIKAMRNYISGGYQRDFDQIRPLSKMGLNVEVTNFHKWAYHFIRSKGINLYGKTIDPGEQSRIIENIKNSYNSSQSNITKKRVEFFIEEISWMKGKLFQSKENYLDSKRTGRGTTDRVSRLDKENIWEIYTKYNNTLLERGLVDFDDYAIISLRLIEDDKTFIYPFTHIIVDEAQDLSKAQMITISKIVSPETNSISIIADAAQRIYKSGFTWSEVGINVRGGRTIEFKNNYRNTVSIANAALSLLSKDSDREEFTEAITTRKGDQKPILGLFNDWGSEMLYLSQQLILLNEQKNNNTVILHRTNSGTRNIKDYLEKRNHQVEFLRNDDNIDFESNSIKVCTLSSIKGLEFDNVFIVDVNDDIIPFPPGFNDENDEFHISTERRLLYTAMTRARENLFLLSSSNPSRYLSEIDDKFVEKI